MYFCVKSEWDRVVSKVHRMNADECMFVFSLLESGREKEAPTFPG